MVRLKRPDAPPKLRENQSDWTERWKRIRADRSDGDWATKTAKETLKPVLRMMSHGKCAFCETRLHEPNEPHIEHYTAKTVNEEIVFNWENLLPACSDCNTAKRNDDHQGALLKPDTEDPEPFFWLNPANGNLEPHPSLSAAKQARAAHTIQLCNLRRGALSESRRLIWNQVIRWIERAGTSVPVPKLHEELNEFLNPGHPHKLVIRLAFTESNPGLADEDRRRFAQTL